MALLHRSERRSQWGSVSSRLTAVSSLQMNEFCISCGKCHVKQHSKGSTGEIKEQNYIFDHGVWRGGKRI
ncbi:unnamed protein product [Eretmochelys imbricata]